MSTLTQSLIPDFEFAKGCRFDTWNSFVEHLDGRSQPVSLKKVLGRKQGSLLWGLAQAAGQSLQSEMIALSGWHDGTVKLRAEDARILIEWQEITDLAQPSVEQVIRAIGIAGVLPQLTAFSSSDEWSRLVQGLHEIFQSAQSQSAGALGQLANELGLTLSYQLPEWKRAARLRKSCLATWANALQEMLDRDGAVQARDSRWIPLLLATWTRTYRIAGQTGFQLDDETQQIWEWFLRYALRLLRADGTSMLAEPRVPFCPNLYHSAVATSTDKEDRAIARQVLPTEKPKKKRVKSKRRASEVFADPGTFSEWAGMGVLQQDWSPRSPRLALAYDESFFQVEVCCGETLFQVHGLPDISINGRLLNAEGEWEELVSHFDDDLDFVELQIRMEGGVLLQRQLCLIHDEQTVMIADAILRPPWNASTIRTDCRFRTRSAVCRKPRTRKSTCVEKKSVPCCCPSDCPNGGLAPATSGSRSRISM